MRRTSLLAVVLGAATLGSTGLADPPRWLNLQGRLTDVGDVASLQVGLWDAEVGGQLLFTELHPAVTLADGVFSIQIGSLTASGVPVTALNGGELWLSLQVNGQVELPRTRLLATPYSFSATTARELGAAGAPAAAMATPLGLLIGMEQPGELMIGGGAGAGSILAKADGGAGAPLLSLAQAGGNAFELDVAAGTATWRNGQGSAMAAIVVGPTGDGPWTCFDSPLDLGGEFELANRSGVLTVFLDGDDTEDGFPCDGKVEVFDADSHLGGRLHSDSHQQAGELGLYLSLQDETVRETVELVARATASFEDGGAVRLRDAGGTTTVELNGAYESSSVWQGGRLQLSLPDGSPSIDLRSSEVFEGGLQAGSLRLYDRSGNIAIELDAEISSTGRGRVVTGELQITGGSDLSEQFDISTADGTAVEPGLVVSIDARGTGALRISSQPYDRCVAGIVSGAGGVSPGLLMGQRGSVADGAHPVALTGRVWTWCDATRGAIQPGDLLTTSATPGHAMRVTDHTAAQGAIIGKAMTALPDGRGLVLVLVSLQ